MNWIKKLVLTATLALPALGYACGDYCDSGWAGAAETGGYSSMYGLYQTTLDIDITTTTYAPVYSNSIAGGGGCSSVLASCGGMNDFGMPNSTGYPSLSNPNQVPRDPYSMDPYAPSNPVPGFGPSNPYVNTINRDPAVLPPVPMPTMPPYGMNPGAPPLPPYTGYPPVTPPMYPPMYPPVPMVPNPIASLPSTPPGGSTVPRDPSTSTYQPPPPAPWGGCDGITVPCPGGPVTRPNPTVPGNTGGGTYTPPYTAPSAPTIFNPSPHTGGSPPQGNEVPRGARVIRTR